MNEIERAIDSLVEDKPLTEGVLELLDEIPDGYSGSSFSDEDRNNIRMAIKIGKLSDGLPTYGVMMSYLANQPGSKKVDVKTVDWNKVADQADVASLYVVHALAKWAKAVYDYPDGLPIEGTQ